MKYLTFYILFFFLISFSNVLSQINIDKITYSQTCAKCIKFNLTIEIKKDLNTCILKVKYNTTSKNIDTSYTLSTLQFDNLAKDIVKISSNDIIYSDGGLDGGDFILEFGNFGNTVRYIVWSPNYDTEKRKLKPFLNICNQIINLASLNSDILH